MIKTLFSRLSTVADAPPWGAAAGIIAIIVAFVFTVLGIFVGAAWFGDPASLNIPPFAQWVGWLIAGVLSAIFVLQTRRQPADRAALRMAPSGWPVPLIAFIAFGLAIALDLFNNVVTGQFVVAPELSGFNSAEAGFRDWIVLIGLMVVVQPVAEELVFRGVAQPALRKVLGGIVGWVVASVLFGIFHFLAYPTNYPPGSFMPLWIGLVMPVLEGLTLGAIRITSGSTRSAIAAHAAFGLFALAKLVVLTT